MRIKSLLTVILVLFVIETAVILSSTWMLGSFPRLRINEWVILEWLINYQGGFVRRGLAGEAFAQLANGGKTLGLVYAVTLAMFLAYCGLFLLIYGLSRVRSTATLLLTLIIPGGLWHMALGPSFFTRKEMVFLLLFALLCLTALGARRADPRLKPVWIGSFVGLSIIGGALSELIHEAYLFMGAPITTLLYWVMRQDHPQQRRLIQVGWIVYISLVTGLFALSVHYHGSSETAQAIWDSIPLADRLLIVPSAPYTVYGTIGGIGWGMRQHLSTIYGVFVTGGIWFWLLFGIGNATLLSYVALRIASAQPAGFNSNYTRLIAIGFMTSMGMMLIGSDWGRWLAAAGNQTILLAFTLNESPYARQARAPASIGRLGGFRGALRTWILAPASYLLLLIYGFVFDMPECCVYFEQIFVKYPAYAKALLQSLSH